MHPQYQEWQDAATAWETMSTAEREALCIKIRWINKRGTLTPTGKRIARTSFAGLSLAEKRLIKGAIL